MLGCFFGEPLPVTPGAFGSAILFSSRILYFYILTEQLKVFILAAVGMTLIMTFGALIVYLNEYPLPLESLMRILPYHTPILFPWILPLSMLMATTLTYGRLASENELLAIQMCGMHLIRPVMPAITLGVVMMVLLFGVNDRLLPWCRQREYEVYLQESDRILVRLFETTSKMKGGSYTITWEGYRDGTLQHVTIRQHEGGEPLAEYTAETATYRTNGAEVTLELKNITGTHFRDGLDIKWDAHTQTIPIKGVFTSEPGYKALDTAGLLRELEKYGPDVTPPTSPIDQQMRDLRVRTLWITIHRRFSLAASALAFTLLGVPLGILARPGVQLEQVQLSHSRHDLAP